MDIIETTSTTTVIETATEVVILTEGIQGPPGTAAVADLGTVHLAPTAPLADTDEMPVLDSAGGLFTTAKTTLLALKTSFLAFVQPYLNAKMSIATYDVDVDGVVDSAESVYIHVRNATGAIIPKGSAVYISGATGQRPIITLAQANAEATSSKTLGLTTTELIVNADGYVVVVGRLAGLDTSAFLDGATLWLSPTVAGGLTSTPPASPNHAVFVGYCAYSQNNNGIITVNVQNGYELSELHDVLITGVADKDSVYWDAATSLWKNITPAAAKVNLALNNVDNTSDVNKPVSTAQATAIGLKLDAAQKGAADGVAPLDVNGFVPSANLPAYVDDVVEYANLAAFPVTGIAGIIYVALDTNKTYRWGGTSYTYITSGAVDSVAGKTGVVTLVKADVGLGNVDNTSDVNKPISTATQTALDLKVSQTAIQSQTATAFTTGGTSTAYTLTTSPSLPALTTNESFRVTFHTASGATPTIARDGLTSKLLKQYNSLGAKVTAVVYSGQISEVQYDGTDYVVLNRMTHDSGHNLIVNANFEVPINQKGSASRVTTTSAYNFDQWYYGSDTKLYQPIEYLNLAASQVYVLNWEGTATCEYKFATVGSSGIVADGGAWTAISKKGTLTAPSDVITGSKFLWIRWTGVTSALATFDKPQLEEGTFATAFERKTYEQNLRECQRYLPYFRFTGAESVCGGIVWNLSSLLATIQIDTRIAVTGLVVSSQTLFDVLSAAALKQSIAIFLNIGGEKSAELGITVGSNFTTGDAVIVRTNSAGYLYFTGAQI